MSARPASESPFPYGSASICYFTVTDGVPEQVKGRPALRGAIANGCELYAAWPGQFRTDLFVIDKPALLRDAIGGAA